MDNILKKGDCVLSVFPYTEDTSDIGDTHKFSIGHTLRLSIHLTKIVTMLRLETLVTVISPVTLLTFTKLTLLRLVTPVTEPVILVTLVTKIITGLAESTTKIIPSVQRV